MKKKEKVLVVGGGPAGMMAAWALAPNFEVLLCEKEKMLGQKFLLAGKGGLNITNHLTGAVLQSKYTPPGLFEDVLGSFDSIALRDWLSKLGIPTFKGSSGRVFPEKGIKTAQVLSAFTHALQMRGVQIHLRHRLIAFTEDMEFTFSRMSASGSAPEEFNVKADYAVLAMGGASWPVTGSDGKWIDILSTKQLQIVDFEASNCGVNIHWPETISRFHTGKPLKNILLSAKGEESRGEALIADYGLEGNAVYPLIPHIRKQLTTNNSAWISIDFKPQNSIENLLSKFRNKKQSTNNYSTVFNLDPASMAIIKAFTDKETFANPETFVSSLKNLSIPVDSLRPIEEAISTVGGLDITELNADFSLKKFPNIYSIGEMLDWDAPTGGFLLQGCFAMGYYVGNQINKKACTGGTSF